MAANAPKTILVEIQDRVAWVRLNRPEAANSRNQRMRQELLETYSHLAADPEVVVLVLTGAGERFFCAGMDLKEAAHGSASARLTTYRDIEALAAFPKPTIAAINGYALGGGCEMALACDIRVMASEAQIGLPEVRLGLFPGGGGAQRLQRLIGPARAFEMIYGAQQIGGRDAQVIGLVNRAVPRAELLTSAADLANHIAGAPAEALMLAKAAMVRGAEIPLSRAVDADLQSLILLLDGAEVGSKSAHPRPGPGYTSDAD